MIPDYLLTDRVTLVKKNGKKFDNIRASVQKDKIFSNDKQIPIEDGDIFERKLPSGVVEQYTILDAGYQEGIAGMESFFQSVVRKVTKIEPRLQPTQNVYNLIGPNPRVNIQSVDGSTNIVGIEPTELFEKLRVSIKESVSDKELLEKLQQKVSELEKTQGTNSFLVRYQEFIALAANHMTILAPFIPALTQMLK